MFLRKFSTALALLFGALLSLAACVPAETPNQPPTAEPVAQATATESVTSTESVTESTGAMLSVEALKNATYSGIYEEPVTLTDGLYEGGEAGDLRLHYKDNDTLFGDLDGDGVDDAVVFLQDSGGGTAAFIYVAAQLNQDGQPVDAGAVMVDDRVQFKAAAIEDGQVNVEVTTRGPGDADCCASYLTHKTYALQEGKLAETSSGDAEPVRVSAAELDGTSWRLVELGENEPVADDVEITIAFAGDQLSGKGGCNNYNGSFTLDDVNPFAIAIGPLASTRMLCPDPAGSLESAYFDALGQASLWGYDFGNLVISYGSGEGRKLLRFTAQPTEETVAAANDSLTGVTWQWVGLTDPMQQVTIDSPESYTLTFLDDGSIQIHADCNEATASYTATADGGIEVTPGVTTLALCGPESRSEELIQKLGFAARYFFQDGHLFIDMMADGGTLEFQP